MIFFSIFKRTLVISQLQPLDARKVFPGFDEPNLKAKFLITIECHQGKKYFIYNILSVI
jgi:aminopeptidase N